jgi:hypothetical protein
VSKKSSPPPLQKKSRKLFKETVDIPLNPQLNHHFETQVRCDPKGKVIFETKKNNFEAIALQHLIK